jgi:hypothetical protein
MIRNIIEELFKKFWFMSVQQQQDAKTSFTLNFVTDNKHPFDYVEWANRNSNYQYTIISYKRISRREWLIFQKTATLTESKFDKSQA